MIRSLSDSNKQIPRAANRFAASQAILQFLRNQDVYYIFHNSPPLVPTLNQISPVEDFPSYFFNIYSNIILNLRLGFSNILFL